MWRSNRMTNPYCTVVITTSPAARFSKNFNLHNVNVSSTTARVVSTLLLVLLFTATPIRIQRPLSYSFEHSRSTTKLMGCQRRRSLFQRTMYRTYGKGLVIPISLTVRGHPSPSSSGDSDDEEDDVPKMTPKKRKINNIKYTKSNLPSKVCCVCNRPFEWRKKWAKVWEEVKYCSEKCRRASRK